MLSGKGKKKKKKKSGKKGPNDSSMTGEDGEQSRGDGEGSQKDNSSKWSGVRKKIRKVKILQL